MIRSAGSIDANIVVLRRHATDPQFIRFLNIAVNSANELEAHLIMALDLNVMNKSDYLMLLEKLKQVRRMLHGLIKYLEAKRLGAPKPVRSVRPPGSD
jgi:four helix bundle protein